MKFSENSKYMLGNKYISSLISQVVNKIIVKFSVADENNDKKITSSSNSESGFY
jgi:hypothetical protein